MAKRGRLGDSGETCVKRSRRHFQKDDGWYFTTREGATIGPYETEVEVARALHDFVEFISLADLPTLESYTDALKHQADDEPGDGRDP